MVEPTAPAAATRPGRAVTSGDPRLTLHGRTPLATAIAAALLALAAPAAAQPFPPDQLPPELRPWVPWVMADVPDYGCVAVAGTPVCAWPGRLRLELSASGGSFALDAAADRETDLALPGDGQRWPQEVRVDGQPAAVRPAGEAPVVRLGAGTHRILGRFTWDRLPDSLTVPGSLPSSTSPSTGGRSACHVSRLFLKPTTWTLTPGATTA